MLTRKQRELLLLICDRLAEGGVPPSFDEMKDALALKSKSGIHRLIIALEERGFIKRLPHRARALEVLKVPDGSEAKEGEDKASFLKAWVEQKNRAEKGVQALASKGKELGQALAEVFEIPLLGRIAAGTPIEAISEPRGQLGVPASLLGRGKGGVDDLYALEIAGDSMVEAGIMDGDHVIIRRADTAENGAIVVALVDENEATLKYLERRAGSIALIPANARYETRLFEPGRVRVQGQLVGLVRRY